MFAILLLMNFNSIKVRLRRLRDSAVSAVAAISIP